MARPLQALENQRLAEPQVPLHHAHRAEEAERVEADDPGGHLCPSYHPAHATGTPWV